MFRKNFSGERLEHGTDPKASQPITAVRPPAEDLMSVTIPPFVQNISKHISGAPSKHNIETLGLPPTSANFICPVKNDQA
jgi:hypothetical protein